MRALVVGMIPACLSQATGNAKRTMTELQTRAQFSMWAVLAAPLLISGSVLEMSDSTLATYSNADVIKVSQDSLGRQGSRVFGGALHGSKSGVNVWSRPLADGSHALVFINAGIAVADVTCDEACFGAMAIRPSDQLRVRDLWSSEQLPIITNATLTFQNLVAAGGHRMVIVSPVSTRSANSLYV